ncbi:hypothetical protein Tco_0662477 [Tanacetum coccineum]
MIVDIEDDIMDPMMQCKPPFVAVCSSLRLLKPKCTNQVKSQRDQSIKLIRHNVKITLVETHKVHKLKQRVLCIILEILPEHLSDTSVFTSEDGNPA